MPTQAEIKQYLVKRDRLLKPVIESCTYPRSRKNSDLYFALVSSIISQQLSVKAADTIFQRFLALFDNEYPDPEIVKLMSLSRMRKSGLSRQKATYIKNVARYAISTDGIQIRQFSKKSNNDVVDELTQIKGVGQWTVEMLLMFAMDRKDVFTTGDLGIQQAMQRLYKLPSSGKTLKLEMHKISEKWKPYRSIVCKYLWQWKAS